MVMTIYYIWYMCRFTSISIPIDNAIELLCMHILFHTQSHTYTLYIYIAFIFEYIDHHSRYIIICFLLLSFLPFTPFIHTNNHIVVLHLHNLCFLLHVFAISPFTQFMYLITSDNSYIEFHSRSSPPSHFPMRCISISISYHILFVVFIRII